MELERTRLPAHGLRGWIYLDHNATTPVLPEVREDMLPCLAGEWGNPSSSYRFGSKLKSVIESAREQIGELIGAASPREILFTGSGTESNNTALHAAVLSLTDLETALTGDTAAVSLIVGSLSSIVPSLRSLSL